MREDRVVIDPHDADNREADHVGGERGPSPHQVMGEVPKAARLSDGEDKKRDRNREYTITERFDASLVHAALLSPRGLITTSRTSSDHVGGGQLSP
jgi:hypothetical protein